MPVKPDVLSVQWYAVINDLVGGWAISTVDKPLAEHDFSKDLVVGDFLTEEIARYIVNLHNALISTSGEVRNRLDLVSANSHVVLEPAEFIGEVGVRVTSPNDVKSINYHLNLGRISLLNRAKVDNLHIEEIEHTIYPHFEESESVFVDVKAKAWSLIGS